MIWYKTTAHLVFLLLLMMLLLKIIPLYTIWNTKISQKSVWVFVLLLVVYIIFMIMNKQYINEFINNLIDLIIYKKNTLPLMQQLENLRL
jgi:Ca2+/Na+ antiporter